MHGALAAVWLWFAFHPLCFSRLSFQIFTLGYSTARNIGIGSYVLRLGQRVIQHVDAPIILTGYQVGCHLIDSLNACKADGRPMDNAWTLRLAFETRKLISIETEDADRMLPWHALYSMSPIHVHATLAGAEQVAGHQCLRVQPAVGRA